MGYTKYNEDDKEIYIERLDRVQGERRIPTIHIESFACPYCSLVTQDKKELHSHIKISHNITHPIIVVNDKVVNSSEFYIKKLENIQVLTYGFNDSIKLEGFCVEQSEITDLTEIAREAFSQKGCFTINVGNKTIQIVKYNVSTIRNKLITPIIRDWEKNIESKKSISMPDLSVFTHVEQEYLRGFYNYFLGCIAKAQDKEKRYYESYSILSSFNPISSLGICVLKIIAFRLNWVGRLKELCEYSNDEFRAIYQFYNNEQAPLVDTSVNYNDSLYVEDDIRDCIDAIVSYLSNDLNKVRDYLTNHDIQSIEDINLRDRILLLSSKLAMSENKFKEAKRYNNDILCKEFVIKIG